MGKQIGIQIEYGTQFNPFGWFYGLFIPNCIAQAPIPDSSKLLLGRLFQYAGKDGKAFPSRKQLTIDLAWKMSKLDRVIKALKKEQLIETYQPDEQSPSVYVFLFHAMYNMDDNKGNGDGGGTVTDDSTPTVKNNKRNKFNNEKGFTNVNCPASGQGSKPVVGSRTVQAKTKNLDSQSTPVEQTEVRMLREDTLRFLKYWNNKPELTTHKIAGRREVSPYSKQSQLVKKIDTALHKVLTGEYYDGHTGIQKGLQKRKFRYDEIEKCIDKMAVAASPGYRFNDTKPSFLSFIHNPHSKIGTGKNKNRFRYPLIHFMNNDPEPIENQPNEKKSEYPILVDKTIKLMTGTVQINSKERNQVVTQIDKAMVFIKKVSNGNLAENRMKLPLMLRDTMLENRLDLTVKDLPLGVYNLEKFMKKRLMIQ